MPSSALSIEKVFDKADVIVSAVEPERELRRFVYQVLSYPFGTPTPDEFGMAIAYSVSLRSSTMGRRVGASILSAEGDLISSGYNEVPAAKGGHYSTDTGLPVPGDAREPWYRSGSQHARSVSGHETLESRSDEGPLEATGIDPSDEIRVEIFRDLLRRVSEVRDLPGLGSPAVGYAADSASEEHMMTSPADLEAVLVDLLSRVEIREAQAFDVIEFGRSVHAEMSAITSCARRGLGIDGSTLYCTTMPCHECAPNIIASGIGRVVYVEAYPKTRVFELYNDSAVADQRQDEADKRVVFAPFVGITPWRLFDLFSWVARKHGLSDGSIEKAGHAVHWSIEAHPPVRSSIEPEGDEKSAAHFAGIWQREGAIAELAGSDQWRSALRRLDDQS